MSRFGPFRQKSRRRAAAAHHDMSAFSTARPARGALCDQVLSLRRQKPVAPSQKIGGNALEAQGSLRRMTPTNSLNPDGLGRIPARSLPSAFLRIAQRGLWRPCFLVRCKQTRQIGVESEALTVKEGSETRGFSGLDEIRWVAFGTVNTSDRLEM